MKEVQVTEVMCAIQIVLEYVYDVSVVGVAVYLV